MNDETTALAPSSAVVSVSSTLAPLKARLETAVANLKTADPGHPRMKASNEVGEALEAIRSAIDTDDRLKARPALAQLLETNAPTDPEVVPGIQPAAKMAMSDTMAKRYYADVIKILEEEINAPEGGKRRRRTRRRKGVRKLRRGGERRYRGDLPSSVEDYDKKTGSRPLQGDIFWNIRDIKNIATGETNIRNEDAPRPGSTLAAVKDRPAQEARQKLVELVVKKHPPKVGETVEIKTLPQFLADELRRARKSGTQTYFSKEYFNGLEPADTVNGQLDVLVERSFSLSYDELHDVASTLKTDKIVNLTNTQVDRLIPLLERLSNTKDFIHLGRVAPLAPGNTAPKPAAAFTVRNVVPKVGTARRRRPTRSTRRR